MSNATPASSSSEPAVKDTLKRALAGYRNPSAWRSVGQLTTTLVAYLGLWLLMFATLNYSYWLSLLLAIPAAGFLVRLFIIQHDCGHHSYFRSHRWNDRVGLALSVLTFTPYHTWRRLHAAHHASSGDLDRRGFGDINTLTVAEYERLTKWQKLKYRVYRNPLILFTIGALYYFVIQQRFPLGLPKNWKKERRNIQWTNLALVVAVVLGCLVFGTLPFVLVQLPVLAIASSVGVWMFYVQHNFEGTYWEKHQNWDFADACLQGSSYYALPKVLQWMTASIGVHHIHHLDSRIPNYRLQNCMDENPEFQQVTRLTFWQSLRTLSLRLWDEQRGEMVSFRALKKRRREAQMHAAADAVKRAVQDAVQNLSNKPLPSRAR